MRDVTDRLPAPRWLAEGERKRDQATLLLRGAAQLLRELAKEATDRPLSRHTSTLVDEYVALAVDCDMSVAGLADIGADERRAASERADLRVLTDAGVDVFACNPDESAGARDFDPGDENDHHSRRVDSWRGVYPGMCVDPEICRGKTHCPRDYSCCE